MGLSLPQWANCLTIFGLRGFREPGLRGCSHQEGWTMSRIAYLTVALVSGYAVAGPSALPANATDPEAAARVSSGQESTANAAGWGFDAEDATACLQAAIDSGAARVIVPYMGAEWIVRPIKLRSGLELFFEPGVVVLAKEGEFKGKGDCLFAASNASGITLRGYGATLRMRHQDYVAGAYEPAEWRMVLSFSGCRQLRVEGLRLESSGGDGIYLGTTAELPYCEDVVIRDVVCHDNHRQGISVIGAVDLLIERCVLSNTNGTAPEAGIDFEPNHAKEKLVNCAVRNCLFDSNAGAGVLVYLKNLDTSTSPVSILVEDCLMRGQNDVGMAVGAANDQGPKGWIEFRNCIVEGPAKSGAFIYDKSVDSVEVRFVNCHWRDVWQSESPKHKGPRVPLLLSLLRPHITKKPGGILFTDCHVYDTVDRPALVSEMGKHPLSSVTGTITVHTPHAARLDLGGGGEDVNLVAVPGS